MNVHSLQQQARTSSLLSVTAASVMHTEATTKTQVAYARFTLGWQLPACTRGGDLREGFVLAFVAYSATTIQRTTTCSFSISASLPRTKDPLQKLKEDGQRDSGNAAFFTTTTVAVFYFGFVLQGAQATRRAVAPPPPRPLPAPKQPTTAHEPAVPAQPSFKPAPQDASVSPAAAGSLNPVGPSRTWGRSNWKDLPFDPRRYRYEVLNASAHAKDVRVRMKDQTQSIRVTPRSIDGAPCIDEYGESFTGVDAVGNVHRLPFSEMTSLSVT